MPTGTGTDGDAVTDDENPGGLEPCHIAISCFVAKRVANRSSSKRKLCTNHKRRAGGRGEVAVGGVRRAQVETGRAKRERGAGMVDYLPDISTKISLRYTLCWYTGTTQQQAPNARRQIITSLSQKT